jgi:hypothetical protein
VLFNCYQPQTRFSRFKVLQYERALSTFHNMSANVEQKSKKATMPRTTWAHPKQQPRFHHLTTTTTSLATWIKCCHANTTEMDTDTHEQLPPFTIIIEPP